MRGEQEAYLPPEDIDPRPSVREAMGEEAEWQEKISDELLLDHRLAEMPVDWAIETMGQAALGQMMAEEAAEFPQTAETNATEPAVTYTEFGSNKARDEAVLTIVNRYKQHPAIAHALLPYTLPRNDMPANGEPIGPPEVRFRLLSTSEERELFARFERALALYKDVDDLDVITPAQEEAFIDLTAIYQIMFCCNQALVLDIAGRHHPIGDLTFEDQFHNGLPGLSTAVRRFNVTKGNKFSTFATPWIRQSMGRQAIDTGRRVRLPVYAHGELVRLQGEAGRWKLEHHRDATVEELASATGLTAERIAELRQFEEMSSLDQPLGDDETYTLADRIPDPKSNGIAEKEAELSNREQLNTLLSAAELSEQELALLVLKFGINVPGVEDMKLHLKDVGEIRFGELLHQFPKEPGDDNITNVELGTLLRVSRERVRQVEAKAISKLRGLGHLVLRAS